MSLRALTEVRDVEIVVTGAPMPIDAYDAIVQRVKDLECEYVDSLDEAGVSQGLTDVAAVNSVVTGKTPYQIYVFQLTTDFAGGVYTFAFVEKAPNVESATSL